MRPAKMHQILVTALLGGELLRELQQIPREFVDFRSADQITLYLSHNGISLDLSAYVGHQISTKSRSLSWSRGVRLRRWWRSSKPLLKATIRSSSGTANSSPTRSVNQRAASGQRHRR